MPGIHDYGLFVAACIVLNLAPGQDTMYILGRSIGQGRRIGVASALGVAVGTVVHTAAAALGLSAILATSAAAFLALKVAGACYLVYLGVRVLVQARAPETLLRVDAASGAWPAFRQGVLTNVLNPKVALFFLAFLPQFVVADGDAHPLAFLALGLTFVATGTTWVLVLAVAGARAGSLLTRHPGAQRWLLRGMGVLFVYLGARLLAGER
jgi:threonine/homoserine/homoserine lactone efflux protein